MTIDPRLSAAFCLIMVMVSTLMLAGTYFTTLFGSGNTAKILAVLGILNMINTAINGVLHLIPSKPGAAGEFPLGPKINS
jgi:hypothetical protein